MHPIQIGTCGWSYKDWQGSVYPAKTAAGDYLRFYAEKYPVVEVDSTFYATPARRTVEGWLDKTPEQFRFTLKVPQEITHEKMLLDCEKEVEAFLNAARVLENKLLCCVLQFGYFNREKFASQPEFQKRLEPFLDAWPKDITLAVEVRNKSWMNRQMADCLRARQAVWVLTDQAWMPSPLAIVEKFDPVTGPFTYIRLLGDRKAVDDVTDKFDQIVVDRTRELRDTAEAMVRLAARVPVLAFVNNHYAGFAPATARQLQETIEELTHRRDYF